MRKSTRLQVTLAAALVALLGAALALAGGGTMRVKVEKTEPGQVTIDLNGTTEVVTVADLAEGEKKTFAVGDHEVTVMRVGDDLSVALDDDDLAGPLEGGEGRRLEKRVVVVADGDTSGTRSGACAGKGARHIVIQRGDGEIEVETELEGLLDELGDHQVWVHRLDDDAEHGMVFITKGEGAGEDDAFRWVAAGCCDPDYVTYECERDGTRVQLKKEQDAGTPHICPVCGAELEKVKAQEAVEKHVTVVVKERGGEEEGDQD